MSRARVVLAGVTAVFAIVLLSLDIPVLFNGPLDSPGTLGLLALCLVFAGVALTYDLSSASPACSFGHALYFAIGVYLTTIALSKWSGVLADARLRRRRRARPALLVLGTVSLRVSGIAFAMVTLAFAQAPGAVQKNPDGLTGGDEGLGLNFEAIPTPSSASSTRTTLLARARLRHRRLPRRVRWAVRAPGKVGRRSERTSSGSR